MRLFRRREIRRTTFISAGLSALLVGIFLAFYGATPSLYWLAAVSLLLPLFYKKKYSALGAIIMLALMLGVWRGHAVFNQLKKYDNFYGKTITIQATVSDDSGYNELQGQTEFHVSSVYIHGKKMIGRIQISTRDKSSITRGDMLLITGKLKPPKGTSRQGSISSAKITIVKKNYSVVEKARTRFFEAIHNLVPEPNASLGLGYLVGVRVSIPKELDDQLAVVGLTHIVAVSGYNLTIIVQAVRRLIGKRSAYQSVVFSGLLIAGFLVIAGGSAPITRAAVVCAFSLLAWYFGRTIKPVLLLLLSGGLTAFVNPLYVWGDPGWYLSFLAFGGVLIVAPLITKRFFYKKEPGATVQILLETLCAQLCTIPYTLFLFGGVSVIAPIANVVVLPYIPFIMLMIFFVGFVGMFLPVIAVWAGIIPSALLSFQIWLIEKLSTVPGAHAEIQITAITMVLGFAGILMTTVLLGKSVSRHRSRHRSEQENDLL